MVKLREIERQGDFLSATYEPENSGQYGRIKINIRTGEVVEKHLSEYDKDFPVHYSHALNGLREIAEKEELPEEWLVMWY